MKKSKKNTFLWTDIIIVVVIELILFGSVWKFKIDLNEIFTSSIRSSLFGSLIGTFGTLLGFIITALSILIGIKENEYIKALKETQHFRDICLIYFNTSIWLGIATFYSIVALILNCNIVPIILIGSFIYFVCIARVARCLQMLKRIIIISNN